MTTKKVLNHSAILTDWKSNLVEKNKGRNYSNNNVYMTKIGTSDKTINNTKTPKNNYFSDKTFCSNNYISDLKDKLIGRKNINKEQNYQNNKIDIKISINNYPKNGNEKIKTNSQQHKDNVIYKPKRNTSISKKNESLELESILQNNLNCSTNNLDTKSKTKTNSQNSSMKYTNSFLLKSSNSSNNSFAFNPKLRSNYTSTSNPPRKTETNDFKQNEEKRQETSFNNTVENLNRDIMQTEPCNNTSIINTKSLQSKLSAIEIKIDLMINNKTNENLNEKLNAYKNGFDDVTKLASPAMSKVLSKIHAGYIEVIQKMIEKLNSKTVELDNFTIKFNNINKKHYDLQEEIRFLKMKLSENLKAIDKTSELPCQTNTNINKTEINKSENKSEMILNGHNEIISNMNKININDLEAIYFVDKVNMRSYSVSESNIPKLDFNIFQTHHQEKENSIQIKNYEDYKKMQNYNQNKLNQMEKLSISPMKSFLKEGDRKKLKLNNIDDTTLDKDKLLKISNYTTKNLNLNPFKK